jgi:alpha-beta hydrolase superfamily lysophospholipase
LLLAGCPSEPTDPTTLDCEATEAVVELSTEDGLHLAADYAPASSPDRGAVVLLHMIPPGNDRTSYPPEVRSAIAGRDLSVLNVDRRGAGGSEGIAQEAYEGPGGRLDVEAAVRFLINPALPCPVDPDTIAIVGASNGTTSVMDYAVGHDPSLPAPAALVWMSPGTYTENQNRLPASREVLDQLPLLWLYPTSEPYSTAYIDDAAPAWRFVERGDAHGTRMFDGGALQEQTTTELLEWFGRWIP